MRPLFFIFIKLYYKTVDIIFKNVICEGIDVMKITNISNFMSYNNNTSKIKKNEAVVSKKFDTININKSNIINAESSNALDVDKLKNKMVNEINQENSTDKIEFLRNQISNKTYVVNSEELAKLILSI